MTKAEKRAKEFGITAFKNSSIALQNMAAELFLAGYLEGYSWGRADMRERAAERCIYTDDALMIRAIDDALMINAIPDEEEE